MGQPVIQFQILAHDPDRLLKFYGAMFGWTASADNMLGYREIDTGSKQGIKGGIWPVPAEAPSAVQLFVAVDDLKATADRVAELGGKVVIPPQELPDGDAMAVIVDPEGIPVGLFRAKR